jgi:biopolymer transport protein ExbB/TolQ
MARGLRGLATVAATAPFLGFIVNIRGIANSFQGITGPKSAILAAVSVAARVPRR